MDIDILLGLQAFRNGSGAILAEFLSKMTFLGELNTALVIMGPFTGASARIWART